MATQRPPTSKARGICRYYATPRGCFAGKHCKFLHGEQEKLTPYDKSKTCHFYAAGYCKRGADCWFVHAQPEACSPGSSASSVAPKQEDKDGDGSLCSVCYDKPVTYGLLSNCSHVFCLTCIKSWRGRQGKTVDVVASGVTKTCPMCRAPSKFITPSSVFYPQDHTQKDAVIKQYKASMARVPCKFFQQSLPNARFCPFGNDCFYQHQNEDGSPYDFQHGVDHYIRQKSRYLDMDGNPLEGYPRTSVLQSLQAALDRFRTSLEGLPGFVGIPEDAFDAETILAADSEAPIPDDGTPFVPQSVVEALSEDDLIRMGTMAQQAVMEVTPGSIEQDFFAESFAQGLRFLSFASQPIQPPLLSLPDVIDQPSSANDGDPTLPTNEDLAFEHIPDGIVDEILELLSLAEDEPRATEESPVSPDTPAPSSPQPSPGHIPTMVSGPSPEHTPEASTVAPMVVHDTDPPFMTDGRGRVVWSSSTTSRGRRSRTSTSISGSAPVLHRDKRDAPSGDCVPERSPERRTVA